MAAEKAVLEVEKPIPSDRGAIATSFVTQTAQLAEKATATAFAVVRDVRGELSQRIVGTLAFIDGSQQSFMKLLRGINERADRLSDEVIDTLENLSVGSLRTLRDTSRGVTELATSVTAGLTRPREIRAA